MSKCPELDGGQLKGYLYSFAQEGGECIQSKPKAIRTAVQI